MEKNKTIFYLPSEELGYSLFVFWKVSSNFLLCSLNTLRLWLPQIYQAMNDYEYYNNGTATFCDMLEGLRHKNGTLNGNTEPCVVVNISH